MKNSIKLLIKDLNLKNNYLKKYPSLLNDGFYVIQNFINGDELKNHIKDFDNLMSDKNIPKVVTSSDNRIYGVERYTDNFITDKQKIFMSEFNSNAKYFDDNVYFTLAGEITDGKGNLGSGGGWHRDSPFTNQFKTILYLSDVDDNNGPFQYVKASHKRSKYKEIKKVLKSYSYNQNRFTNDEVDTLKENINDFDVCTFNGKAGDLILVNTRGLHRGAPLLKGKRKAVTTYSFRNNIPKKFFNQ